MLPGSPLPPMSQIEQGRIAEVSHCFLKEFWVFYSTPAVPTSVDSHVGSDGYRA